ncbi:hypothetical protein J4464_07595 [Candidatus Woesearchaeota archaeon]|nr:hypothetical protein [Candidatus Woesearchaeota archaeon]
MKSKDQGNEGFTGLGATLGGITLATVVLFLIFANDQIALVIPIVWAYVVLGAILAFFKYKSLKK